MTVASRLCAPADVSIRPVEFEDLSHLDVAHLDEAHLDGATGGDTVERALPAWVDELLAQHEVVAAPTPIPVVLPHVEAIVEVEPPAPEPDPEAVAAAEELREASIAFDLGHRAGFDHGRAEGHADGYRDGLETGRAEALDAGQREASRLLEALRGAVAEHGARLDVLADEVARAATELAFGIAEQVLQRELHTAADPGADAIRRAVAALPHAGETISAAVVRLHPDDASRLVAEADELFAGVELAIVADADVEPGSCLLDVDQTRVDTSVSAALARVREVLVP